jgi:UDPglucose 6-dehydrogenase
VVGVDVNEAKVATLRRGEFSFFEPYLRQFINLAGSQLRFTTRSEEAIPEAQVVFIAVGTPPLPDGSPDLSRGRSAAEAIGRHLGEGFTVVINESTVPVGSGDYAEVRYG